MTASVDCPARAAGVDLQTAPESAAEVMEMLHGHCIRSGVIALVVAVSLAGIRGQLLAQAERALTYVDEKWLGFGVEGELPQTTGRGIVSLERNLVPTPLLSVWDSNGAREDIWLSVPDAAHVSVLGMAGGADGSIAVVGGAYAADSRFAAFLAWIPPDRKTRVITRLSPYVARRVTVAADGTIWTVGYVGGTGTGRYVVKQFSTTGKELRSVVCNATGPSNSPGDAIAWSYMRSSSDRIGWFTYGAQYIEFALDGTEVGRFDGPALSPGRQLKGVALAQNNELFVSTFGDGKWEILALDRGKRTWDHVTVSNSKCTGGALGFSGDTLVLSWETGKICQYKRSRSMTA